MDLTGRFPFPSSRGNEYILIVYHYDSNARRAAHIRDAFIQANDQLRSRGVKPKIYLLDNEISGEFKKALTKHKLTYQLAPPHQHRHNAAEKGIQTFKDHFIAGLSSTHPKFPISEWDRLIEQATIILNLLCNARSNPALSAYAFLYGTYDFNKAPMAPPGTQVVVHEKPSQRATWAPHGIDGWYVGPALHHVSKPTFRKRKTNVSLIQLNFFHIISHFQLHQMLTTSSRRQTISWQSYKNRDLPYLIYMAETP